ncbi:MAG: transporter [Phycisphaerales bacterium]|nr:transporter [Phycisphaerales bacterium]
MFISSHHCSAVRVYVCAVFTLAAACGPALGQSIEQADADKSRYTLCNPTPRELMREMSTDRPDTTESAYTVDAGHFQLEMSFVDYTYDHNNDDEETRRTWGIAPVLVKVGLLNNVDLQLGLDPYTGEKVTDRTSDTSQAAEGFGDTVVRLKVNLWGNDGGTTALALMPFIKLPTADDELGNDDAEGGLIAPLAIALPGDFSMGLMAELDYNRSAADDRYVVDFLHTATIGHDLIGDLAGYIEYAGLLNLNGDEDYRGYFDGGLTYALTPDVQFDAGFRIGVTEAADDLGLFAGISFRL